MTSTFFTISPTAPHKMSRRKYPLTPPCVSPPALTTSTYSSRPELNRSQTTPKATTLLSKVARNSPSSRRGSPTGSPPSSPSHEKMMLGEKSTEQRYEPHYREKDGRVERSGGEWVEELQYWRGSEQRGQFDRPVYSVHQLTKRRGIHFIPRL